MAHLANDDDNAQTGGGRRFSQDTMPSYLCKAYSPIDEKYRMDHYEEYRNTSKLFNGEEVQHKSGGPRVNQINFAKTGLFSCVIKVTPTRLG